MKPEAGMTSNSMCLRADSTAEPSMVITEVYISDAESDDLMHRINWFPIIFRIIFIVQFYTLDPLVCLFAITLLIINSRSSRSKGLARYVSAPALFASNSISLFAEK